MPCSCLKSASFTNYTGNLCFLLQNHTCCQIYNCITAVGSTLIKSHNCCTIFTPISLGSHTIPVHRSCRSLASWAVGAQATPPYPFGMPMRHTSNVVLGIWLFDNSLNTWLACTLTADHTCTRHM